MGASPSVTCSPMCPGAVHLVARLRQATPAGARRGYSRARACSRPFFMSCLPTASPRLHTSCRMDLTYSPRPLTPPFWRMLWFVTPAEADEMSAGAFRSHQSTPGDTHWCQRGKSLFEPPNRVGAIRCRAASIGELGCWVDRDPPAPAINSGVGLPAQVRRCVIYRARRPTPAAWLMEAAAAV